MDIKINLGYGEYSTYNLAFIKAMLIKYNIEKKNITYRQKEKLRKEIVNKLEGMENI